MRNDDRFIPGEEIKDVAQWEFAAIETAAQLLQAQVREREAQQQQAHAQDAYQEGFAAGVEHGKQMAQQEVQRQMQAFRAQQAQDAGQRFAALFQQAEQRLKEVEQTLAQGTLELACELSRQVVRRELTIDKQAVVPVLKEALSLLESQHKVVQVKLHPQDVQTLGAQIQTDFEGLGVTLRADASMKPGDCVVESAGTVVDGTVAKRWQRAVAALGLSSHWEQTHEPE